MYYVLTGVTVTWGDRFIQSYLTMNLKMGYLLHINYTKIKLIKNHNTLFIFVLWVISEELRPIEYLLDGHSSDIHTSQC